MTALTRIAQRRATAVSGASTAYTVETSVLDKGELPDTGLFVFQILAKKDPSRDTYVRIAAVADYLNFTTDRARSITDGQSFYRASSFTRSYSDVNVAVTAKNVIEGYIDELVNAYVTYTAQFSTDGIDNLDPEDPDDVQIYEFPLVGDSAVTTLKTDYETKAQQVTDKEAEIAAAAESCATHLANLTTLQSDLTFLQTLDDQLTGLSDALSATIADLGSALTSADALAGEVDAGIEAFTADEAATYIAVSADSLSYFLDPDPDTDLEVGEGSTPPILRAYQSAANVSRRSLGTLRSRVAMLAGRQQEIDTKILSKQAEVAAKEADYLACGSAKSTKEQELAALELQAAGALAAVLEVCPDYVAPT